MGAVVLAIIWGGFLIYLQGHWGGVSAAFNSALSPDALLGSIIHFLW